MRSQRRFFQSSLSVHRPVGAAAAQHEEEQGSTNPHDDGWTGVPAPDLSGGWARNRNDVQLTAGEEREREILRSTSYATQSASQASPSQNGLAGDSVAKSRSPREVRIQAYYAKAPPGEDNVWIATNCLNCGTKIWSSGSRCRNCGKFSLPVKITRPGANQPSRATVISGASDIESSTERGIIMDPHGAESSRKGGGISFDPPSSTPTFTEDSPVSASSVSPADAKLYKDQTSDQRVPNSRRGINRTPRLQPLTIPHAAGKNVSANDAAVLPWIQKDGSGAPNVLLPWTDVNVSTSFGEQLAKTTKGSTSVSNHISESAPTLQPRPRDEILDKHISLLRSSPSNQETTAGNSQRPFETYEWDCGSCGQTNYKSSRTCRRCNVPRPLMVRRLVVNERPDHIRPGKHESQHIITPVSIDASNASGEVPARYWKHVRKRQSTVQGEPKLEEPGSEGQDVQRDSQNTRLEDIETQRSDRLRASSNGRFVGLQGGRKHNLANAESMEKRNASEIKNSIKTLVPPPNRENHQPVETVPKDIVQQTPSPVAWMTSKSSIHEAPSPSLHIPLAAIEPAVTHEETSDMNDRTLDTELNLGDSMAETLYPKAADIAPNSGGWAVWKPPVVEKVESTPSQSQESDSGPLTGEHVFKDEHVTPQSFQDEKVNSERLSASSSVLWKPPVFEPKPDFTAKAGKADSDMGMKKGPYPSGVIEKPNTMPAFKVWKPTSREVSESDASMPESAAETQVRRDGNANDRVYTRDSESFVVWRPTDSEPESVPSPQLRPVEDSQSLQGKDSTIALRAARRAAKFVDESEVDQSRSEQTPTGNSRNWERGRSRRDQQYLNEYEDEEDLALARAERKKQRKRDRAAEKAAAPPTPIILPEFISIGNLASALRVRIEDFVERMESLGFEETNSDYVLDAETAGLIATEFNYDPITDRGEAEDLVARSPAEDQSLLPPRPPVVTIMGHVDHGKTTLLDWLRKSSVAASEHGGITQHIGAFTVPMPSGKIITFLDTPGHAAFLSMRQRGAHVTDIVILVVAADDSVKPQTIEAIKHAQAAKVPIIVAINKIDKEGSNVERVKQDLARHGVDVEDFGGDTQVVCVSGKTGQGMEELEDAAVALADILDMRAETDGPAEGWILEATTKKAGRVATVLVRSGTMYPGSVIVAGSTWAKVRTLKNEAGVQIDAAGPGTPVEIDGWREQPEAGDEVLEAPDEQRAKAVIDLRLERAETNRMAVDMVAVNEARRMGQEKRELGERATDGQDTEYLAASTGIKEVFFIIKADVSGSVEAVLNSVSALGNEEVRPHVLRSAVGPVGEFDVEHAAVAKGHIISFNTPVDPNISRMAEVAGVSILEQNIIYRLVDDVKAKLSEQLAPSITSRVLGEAEIAQVFDINTKGRITISIAGCRVRNGVLSKNGMVRVLRDRAVIYDGLCFSFSTHLHVLNHLARFPFIPQEPEERCHGNAQGERMRSWVRGLYGFPGWGPGAVLRGKGREANTVG